jgi:hypothetical protein
LRHPAAQYWDEIGSRKQTTLRERVMRLITRFVGILLLAACGCTHVQLRNSTVKQASTLTEVHYLQVLNNLAMFVGNADAMPYFAVVGGGSATLGDSVSATPGVTWDKLGYSGSSLSMSGQRQLQENWTLASIADPDKLKKMRCAYRWAVGCPAGQCEDCAAMLTKFFGEDFAICDIPQGWFQWGCRKDVPKCACYVGEYCGVYVWVNEDGVDGLTRFTLSILDICTNASHDIPEETATIVRKFKGDPLHRFSDAIETEMTTEESLTVEEKVSAIMSSEAPTDDATAKARRTEIRKTIPREQRERDRLNFYDPYRSLLSLPRSR